MPDVVVVGAGPVGLAVAAGLAARGVSVLVLERRTEISRTSRAAAVHAGTLAVLDDLGVGAEVLAAGLPLRTFRVSEPGRLLYEVDFTTLPGAHRHALAVPQWRTEELLAERVRHLGVEVSRGEGVVSLVPGRVRTDRREVRCRLVVGADGTRSTVRRALGVAFAGPRRSDPYVLADVRLDPAPTPDHVGLHVARPGALVVAPLPGGATRLVAPVPDPPGDAGAGFLQDLLDRRAPDLRAHVRDVLWSSGYEVRRRRAARFARAHADGAAVLVGDAAHEHSPSGGQGMNLGLRDAASLVDPVLALLTRGTPLEDWGAARRAHAGRVLRFTRALTLLETSSAGTRRVLDEVVRTARPLRRVHDVVAHRLAGLDDPVLARRRTT